MGPENRHFVPQICVIPLKMQLMFDEVLLIFALLSRESP